MQNSLVISHTRHNRRVNSTMSITKHVKKNLRKKKVKKTDISLMERMKHFDKRMKDIDKDLQKRLKV